VFIAIAVDNLAQAQAMTAAELAAAANQQRITQVRYTPYDVSQGKCATLSFYNNFVKH